MLRSVLLASAGALALTGAAFAADLPSRGPPPNYLPPPPVFTWTGFYAGVNGGGAWNAGSQDLSTTITSDFPDFAAGGDAVTFFGQNRLNPSGGFGGGQFGYNWQIGSFVVGLEADFQGGDIKASRNLNVRAAFNADGTPDDATSAANARSRLNEFGSLRGRLGYAFGPLLIYGTGGLAFGQVRDALTVVAVDADDPDPIERIRPLSTRTVESNSAMLGFAVGGGGEWMFLPNWSLKVEYQYIDLGRTRLFATSDNAADHAEATTQFDHRYHTVRGALNYHFNLWDAGPVVARY